MIVAAALLQELLLSEFPQLLLDGSQAVLQGSKRVASQNDLPYTSLPSTVHGKGTCVQDHVSDAQFQSARQVALPSY